MITASGASIGVGLSRDRQNVEVQFGFNGERYYYAVFSPEDTIKIADHMRDTARSIIGLKPEAQN